MNVTYMLATAVRSKPESVGADGAFLWIEKTNESRVCYKEAQIFSGLHTGYQTVGPRYHLRSLPLIFLSKNILLINGSGGLQDLVKGADTGHLVFSKKHLDFANGHSVCKVSMTIPYKSANLTILQPNRPYGSKGSTMATPGQQFSCRLLFQAAQAPLRT